MPYPFLGTNVFLRHLAQDHDDHSPRATALFERIERGEVRVRTSDVVVFETVYTLRGFYRQTREQIREAVLPLLELTGISLPNKEVLIKAFGLYVDLNLSLPDAYHVALLEHLGIDEIITFDQDFDRVPGLRRIEP